MRWERDGAVLHLYEIGDDQAAFERELDDAEAHARTVDAAFLYVDCFADDPAVPMLTSRGFAIDAEENDVRNGRVVPRLSLMKLL